MLGLVSMTGHGRAQQTSDALAIDVEVRSVNNRFLKVTAKLHESLSFLEPQIESTVRDKVRRGTVHVSIRVSGAANLSAQKVCVQTLRSYLDQAYQTLVSSTLISVELGSVLQLPGVLLPSEGVDPEKVAGLVLSTLEKALEDLNRMRKIEGEQMAKELLEAIANVAQRVDEIEQRAPNVVSDYRKRLENRVRAALSDLVPSVGEIDLLREVIQFSDRSDIREEIVRLKSHLDQFVETVRAKDSQGRRLDFLTQEIGRETNTIGAKANDSAIAHLVVAIKTTVEQIRELVQNVE
jgi:uncharacterized protein (TIGR00255 family)